MKKYLLSMIQSFARCEKCWWFLNNTLIKVSRRLEWEREKIIYKNEMVEVEITKDVIRKIFPDLTVKNGVFSGLRYP